MKILKEPISIKSPRSPIRRQTYLVREKENCPVSKNNELGRDTILTSPERSVKRPDQRRQDYVFNNHFNFKNLNNSSSPLSDDSLEKPLKMISNNSQFNEFYLTPLKSTENLLSPFSAKSICDSFDSQISFDITDGILASNSPNSPCFKLEDEFTTNITCTPKNIMPNKLSIDVCNQFMKTPEVELKHEVYSNFESDIVKPKLFVLPDFKPEVEQPSNFRHKCEWTTAQTINHQTSKVTGWLNIIINNYLIVII